MTGDRGTRWGPLAWRLLIAFVLVALSSVAVLTTAALLGTGQGLAAATAAGRQQAARQVADAAGSAYAEAGNWRDAQLDAAIAVATAASAHLVVRDIDNSPVAGQKRGRGMPGMGSAMNSASQGGRTDAPIITNGQTIGSVQLSFGPSTASAAQDIAWEWIVLAAAVALLVALTASWFVSRRIAVPLVRLTTAAKAISAGDRSARAEIQSPGELGGLARAFNHMADEVGQAERARRNLTSDVAHELRTPLSTLQAGLEELRDGLATPDAERLTSLHDQTLRLGRIVEDLAELTAAESAASPHAIRPYPARVISTILNAEVRPVTILGLAIVVVIILVCLAWPAADPPKATEVGHVGPAEPGRERELATMDLPDGGSPELLGKLGISMPELPPQALSKAYSLARHGASTDDLVRILKLTRRQAVTIVTNIRVR